MIRPSFLNGKNNDDLAPITTLISPFAIPLQIIFFFFFVIPEIGLTSQFEKKFVEFFGFTPAIWHSGITKKIKKLFGVELQMEKLKLL